MKSVYIAGPYSAEGSLAETFNIMQAAEAAAIYLKQGYAVFCPHTMTSIIDRQYNRDKVLDWQDWMINDIYFLQKCDIIHLLPGWEKSKGATMEYMIAKSLGMEVRGSIYE